MQKHLTTESKSINDSFTLPVLDVDNPITTFDKDVLLATTIRNFSTLPVLYDDPDWFYDECALWWDQHKYDFAHMWMTNEMQYNPIHNYDRHEHEVTTPGVTDIETHSESDTVKHTGKDTTTPSGTTKVEHLGYDDIERLGKTINDTDTLAKSREITEHKESAYNESTYQPSNKSEVHREYDINGEDVPDNIHNEISHEDDKDQMSYNSRTETSYLNAKTELEHGENIKTEYGHKITNTHLGIDQRDLTIEGNIGVMSTQQMMEQEYKVRKFNLYTYMANKFADELCLGIW